MTLGLQLRASLIFLGLLVGAAGAGRVHGQSAGVIQFVAGNATLVAASGQARAARKGVPVSAGDTLVTAPGALAQIKMGDGAIVVVQPESRLAVAEFHYAGREDGNEKVRYRLEQGGFRAITGAIGRTHKRNYLIETPVAHMGVRGTDHEAYYFPAAGPAGAKPGAYNKVNTGRTFIRTKAGEIEVDPNEVGYVASAGDVPVLLPRVPEFFNRSAAPRDARRPAVDPAPQATQTAKVEQVRLPQAPRVEPSTSQGPLAGPVQPGTGQGPLVSTVQAPGPLVGFVDSSFSGNSANGASIEPIGGLSSMSSSGSVEWTTWEGGVVFVDGQTVLGSTHVIRTTNKTDLASLSPSLISATYMYSGGPAPTNELGEKGTINSLSVGVNFSTQMLTGYDLNASAGGVTWDSKLNTTAPHTIADFTGVGGVRLTGSCSGACSGTTSGSAHGTLVGAQAENMITTFGLSGGLLKALSGAASLSR